MLKIALVTNAPPPYRVPIFNCIAKMHGILFQAIFCSRKEPNRLWDLPPMEFDHVFLRERIITANGRYIHNNPDVLTSLYRFSPDVIVTTGFNPTHLYAFGYAALKATAFIPMTDGTYESEKSLSRSHKAIRRHIFARADAFISASGGGQQLYESYGVLPECCFRSCLCVDNGAFFSASPPKRKQYDFIFSGRIEPDKNPTFALHVAAEVARRLNRQVSILFVGSGSQEDVMKTAAHFYSSAVRSDFTEFAKQAELPALYRSARVLLFPTSADVWGVVANEACAAGLPVIVSPHAGVAGELVRDGENGFVCDLDVETWAIHAARLLTQAALYEQFSMTSRFLVRRYTFDQAAAGFVDACRYGSGQEVRSSTEKTGT